MIFRLLSLLIVAAMPLTAAIQSFDTQKEQQNDISGMISNTSARSCGKCVDCNPTIIKSLPYTITKHGRYKLCKDFKFTRTDVAAITILANNVDLDLDQHTIDLGNTGYVGIKIGDGSRTIEDVSVRNGTIKNTPLTQAVATANDFFYPLVATTATYPNGLPAGVNDTYPSPAFNFTVAGILGNSINGAIFENLVMNNVLYGIVVTSPANSTDTFGHITIDRCNIFDFGVAYPSPVTITDVAYGSAIVLAGTPTNPLINLRVTNSNLNSQSSKFSSQVFSADGCVWEYVVATANAGPVPSTTNPPPAGSPLLYPLIQGPISFVNCTSGVVRECEAHNSNTLFEAQYCTGFDFIDCVGWGTFHNGIGILFDSDVVVKGAIIHRAEGPQVTGGAVQPGSGIKLNVSEYVVLEDSEFTGFDIGSTGTDSNGAGIVSAASSYCIISNNAVSGNNYGIKEIYSTKLGVITFNTAPIVDIGGIYYMTNVFYSNMANGNLIKNYYFADNLNPNSPTNPWTNAVVVSTTTNGTAPVAPYVNLEP